MKTVALRYCLLAVGLATLVSAAAVLYLRVSAADELPRVQLRADNVGPRPIEELTSKSVPRDYALAWQNMEQALKENRTDLLEGYFTGFEKEELTERIKLQVKSGLETRYTDRGHQLDAIFYAPAGDAIELRDRAQLDVEIRDGGKVIYQEPVNLDYIVFMTPGADRWLVRQMQAVEGQKP
jgi:hypothetical protein